MIIVKLSEILTRSKLKIADIVRDTGITRTTLTSLSYGHSNGINFDTLNKLCRYLAVNPGDLLQFLNIEISATSITFDDQLFNREEIVNSSGDHIEFISRAVFSGTVALAHPKSYTMAFHGYLTSTHPNNYSLYLVIIDNPKSFKKLLDSDSQDYLIDILSEKILDEFEQYADNPVITSVSVNFSE